MKKLVRSGLQCGEGRSFCHTEHEAEVHKDPYKWHCQLFSQRTATHLLRVESHKRSKAIKETGMLPILISFSVFTRTNKKLQICSQLLYLHLQKLK